MFNQIKMHWHFGKMEAHHRNLEPALSLAESIYFHQKQPPHFTALLNCSLAQLVLMNRFLEAASKVAKVVETPQLVYFPEGNNSCDRMDAILEFIQTEMRDNQALYENGPNFIAVHNQWRSLVAECIELRRQAEFVG